MTQTIITTASDQIAEIVISNSAHRNAITMSMWQQLGEAAVSISNRDDIRVVIIRGEGTVAFSAGADISDFAAVRSSRSQSSAYDDLVESSCRLVEAIKQPTIAAVQGACIGAGASLAGSCDFIIASESAFFAVPAAKLGLGYDPRGIERFVKVFGLRATRRLLYTAEKIPATLAAAMGVVDVIEGGDSLLKAAQCLAQRISANAPLTVQAAKFALFEQTMRRDDTIHVQAARVASEADDSVDYKEGRLAFAQKRLPRFLGR